ncbi:MAG: hypothetical protein MUF49_23020 [Oculatellaceae cyanobacterium Prado106]|nr:hypothetical protein [Oculatellaceae cyanobacterium Prado106]
MWQGQGYVLLFRHAVAPGTGDPPNFQLADCATQRNLSEEGRQQAVRMGEVLRSQNIPISRVLSSQWCRCFAISSIVPESGAAIVMRAMSPDQVEFVGQIDPL